MWAIIIIAIVLFIFIKIIKSAESSSQIDTSARKTTRPASIPIRSTIKALPPITQLCWCVRDNGSDSERLISVAGVEHYTHRSRGIYGTVVNDSLNEYNSKAMAVIAADGEKIGYIPERELIDYWEWTEGAKFPFVGFVRKYDNGEMRAMILVIRPTSKFAILEAARKQAHYLTNVYDTSGYFDPKIPDVKDDALYQKLLAEEQNVSKLIAEETKKDKAVETKPATPRREKWETYFKNFEMLEMTEKGAEKSGLEISFDVSVDVYTKKKITTGLFYGILKADEKCKGEFAVFNKKSAIAHLEGQSKEEFIKFNEGKAVPIIFDITQEDYDEDEKEYCYLVEGEALLPLSEEFLKIAMTKSWERSGGDIAKLPK